MDEETPGWLARLMHDTLGRRATKVVVWFGVGIFFIWGIDFAIGILDFPLEQVGSGMLTWTLLRDFALTIGIFFGIVTFGLFLLAVMLGYTVRVTGLALYHREIVAIKADIDTMKTDIAAIKVHLGMEE